MKSQNGRFLVGQFYVAVTAGFTDFENQKFLSPAIVLERCNLSQRIRKQPQNAFSYFLCEPQAKKDHFCPKSPFLAKIFRTFGPTAPQLKPILTNKKYLIYFFDVLSIFERINSSNLNLHTGLGENSKFLGGVRPHEFLVKNRFSQNSLKWCFWLNLVVKRV